MFDLANTRLTFVPTSPGWVVLSAPLDCAVKVNYGAGCDGLTIDSNLPVLGGSWDVTIAGLQAIYIVLSLYGWYYWLRGGPRGDAAPVVRLGLRAGFVLGVLGAAGATGVGYGLATWTDADLPYWDATTTAFSLVGQWLLAKKVLENWLVWIAVDVLYVGIYVYKELYLTAGLFGLYTVLAVAGFFAWRKTV